MSGIVCDECGEPAVGSTGICIDCALETPMDLEDLLEIGMSEMSPQPEEQ